MRATTSSAPPAANGTTSRTDLSGYAAAVCAREADANAVSASAAASAASFCMRVKPIGAAIPKKLPSMYPVYYRECFTVTARLAHEKKVIYFHSLSSPWAYMGGPRFHALIKKHDLDVVVRPTRIVPPNGGIPLLTRPDARRRYHEVELDRWRKRLNMPLVLRPRFYPTDNQF